MMSALNEGRKSVDANHIENAPISCNLLQQNGSKIIIKDELVEKLAYIKSTIDRQKNTGKLEELPFAMMGYKDEQGNVKVYAAIYEPDKDETKLEPITSDHEWKIIEKILEELQTEARKSVEEMGEDE